MLRCLRRIGTRLACLAALTASLGGCQYLVFLRAPEKPRPPGPSSTERGRAFNGVAARTMPDESSDWPAYNRSFTGVRFSPLSQITTANVGTLRPVCHFDLGERANFQSAPVVVAGIMYFTTALNTYAIDAASCALIWRHTYVFRPAPPFDPNNTNRGVGYLGSPDGARIFRGANDGRVLALDAHTGRQVWNVVAADPLRGETISAAPVAWGNLVYIGNAGGDNYGVTGRIMAFDANTGGRVWSTELVARTGEASRSWPPEKETMPRGGGATWTTYTLDTTTATLYVSTGNPLPDFVGEPRAGANLYTTSVVALDARTGAIRTHYVVLEGDVHDWDVAAAPVLTVTRSGREIVAAAGKDGHLYVFDRASRARLFRTPVTTIENVEAPLTEKGTRFCPGVNGGTEWNGPAFSPQTNAFYVNAVDWCTTVRVSAKKLRNVKGLPWTGSAERFVPFGANDTTSRGWMTAVDAEDGSVRWKYESPTPLVAGVTPTKGGVVFSGDLRGIFFALDAETGRQLFQYDTGRPIGGGVVTYQVNGRQLVAVASGLNSPVAWKLESSPARVVVFGLP
ncbi:MAG TPA: PQQ-binding-like beta-propeller repeat protein [Gemmatimonadaceae bacterium]|nr:PQQ-binding-like beta-propeller repeat protein [Gemmatimonadaceae bacterium]